MVAYYEIQIRKMIERLRDSKSLSDADTRMLNGLMDSADWDEWERRWAEIRIGNDFMMLPTAVAEEAYDTYHRARDLVDHVNWAMTERKSALERAKKWQAKLARLNAQGITTGKARDKAARLSSFLPGFASYMLDDIEDTWNRTDSRVKQCFIPPTLPITGKSDLMVMLEHEDNYFWPDHPNAVRQAYIEVLELKLVSMAPDFE